jgi:cyclopropane fatty-acyl-phospholipid synthase-like methyltransferase
MSADLPPLHEDLTFHGPLSDVRADRLAGFAAGIGAGQVVDIGCGWAELLLRTVARGPSLTGLGIDRDAVDIAHGQALAEERDLQDRVTLVVGDAAEQAPAQADAVICVGSAQVWGDPDAVAMDYAAALKAIRAMLPRGGRAVFGDGIWTREPTEDATTALGGSPDEFTSLSRLVSLATAHGFRPFDVGVATLEEWDEFESGYARGYERWLLANTPEHPDYEAVRARADAHRAAWLDGYRGVLGLAYLCLVAC